MAVWFQPQDKGGEGDPECTDFSVLRYGIGADIQRLAQARNAGYGSAMDDTVWMIFVGIGGAVLWLVVIQRYRRWKAGKLADQLLQDVVKGKDAFRR